MKQLRKYTFAVIKRQEDIKQTFLLLKKLAKTSLVSTNKYFTDVTVTEYCGEIKPSGFKLSHFDRPSGFLCTMDFG